MSRGRRLRVAYFVSPSRNFAGIERVVHEVSTALAADYGDDLDVHVVYSSRYDEAVLDGTLYTQHVLGVRRLRRLPFAVRRAVAAICPDVLVVPQVEASVTVWLATRGLGVPSFVAHLHGNPRVEEELGTRRTRLAFAVFRHLVGPRTQGLFAVSPSLARAAAAGIASGSEVRFVPNPVRGFGGALAVPSDDGVFRFVSVARLSHQKGQDILLRALAMARPRLPPAHLTLVGAGQTRDELESLSRDLGVADMVTFTGYASDPLVQLTAADCFVLASRWEGFGVALVEALDVGLPVLSADCEFGPADVVTDESVGLLVPPEDPHGLAEGMVAMAARRASLADAAQVNARRSISQQYSSATVSKQHRDALYEAYTRSRRHRRTRVESTEGVRP